MLDALRRGASTFVAKLLLSLLVVSFGIWGIAGSLHTSSARAVAEVGDTEIGIAAFQQAYRDQLQELGRRFGQPVDPETAAQLGLPQTVLGQMMSEATLTESARRLGLGVSDQEVANEIAADPAFKVGNGAFDRARFQQLLRQAGLNETQYLADRRDQALRLQLAQGIVGGMTVPKAMVETVARYRNEVRVVDYVVLERPLVEPVPSPTTDEKKAYYDDNKASFRAPEYRKLDIITLTPSAIADPSAISDADARKEYDRTRARYGSPEKRRVQQILFPTADEAKAASDSIKGGASFESVAESRGVTASDLDLGLLTREQMVDPAVADAAFALAPNTVSEPVAARFGSALVRVTEVQPESIQPFEAVADEIRASLATAAAERSLLDLEQDITDARAGGASMKEVADRFKLDLVTVEAVDAEGRGPDGNAVSVPAAERLLAAAFQSDVGVENDPVQLEGKGYAWFDVVSVTPARDKTLEEVDAEVARRWTDHKATELLGEKADALVKQLKDGQDFAAAAGAMGLTPTRSPAFARNGQDAALGAVGIDAAFRGPAGHVAGVETDAGTHIVLKVASAVVPPFIADDAGNADVATAYAREMQTSLLNDYVKAMQASIGSTINQQALQAVIGTQSR